MSRGYLTPREWKELFESQGERCCVPGCESAGPFEAEHSTPVAFRSGKPDQIMCVRHHKIKTRRDKAAIAKAKRCAGDTRSQFAGSKPKHNWPSRPMGRKSTRTREEILNG